MAKYYEKAAFVIMPNVHLLGEMKGAAISIYVALCKHADDKGECFPSRKAIAESSGYSPAQVKRALSTLIKIGVLERTKRTRKNGSITSNSYRILQVPFNDPRLMDEPTPQLMDEPTITKPILTKPLPSTNVLGAGAGSSASEKPQTFGKPEINQLIELFETKLGSPLPQRQLQRYAANRLVKRLGIDKVMEAATFALDHADEPYCPFISSPVDLERKLANLKHFRDTNAEGGVTQL